MEDFKTILDQKIFPECEKLKDDEGIALTEEQIIAISEGKPVEETEEYIRIRVRNPGDFQPGTFRTVWISKKDGINSVQGRLKGETTMTVQSLLFDKEKWTKERALAWVKEHGYKPKDLFKIETFEASETIEATNIIPQDVSMKLLDPINFEIKNIDKKKRIIKGWASTRDLDYQGEIVEPSAFRETLSNFMNNPLMFFMHNWRQDFPIGKVLKAEIVEDVGLWIEAKISKVGDTANKVWELILEGLLKALSIGFSDAVIDEREGIRHILKLNLWEISVVSLPANPMALFGQARAKGIDLGDLVKTQVFVSEDLKGKKQEKTKEVKTMPELTLEKVDERIDVKTKEGLDLIKQIQTDVKGLNNSQSQLKEYAEKVEKDLKKTMEDQMRPLVEKKIRFEAKEAGYEGMFLNRPFLTQDLAFYKCKTPKEKFAKFFEIPSINMPDLKMLQESADDLLLTHLILKTYNPGEYGGIKSLWLYDRYRQIAKDFQKALDTETAGEGADWIPTAFSADLITKYRLQLKVGALFKWFNMPASPFKYPLLTGGFTTYKVAENVGDIGLKIPASTVATSKVQFDAVKLAARGIFSDEVNEDSIVPLLPVLKGELAKAMAEGLEDCLLNGDDSASHFDTGLSIGASGNDRRTMFKGLRKLIIDGGENVDISATGFTAAKLRTLRKTCKKYGINPSELAWIVSISGYIQMLSFTEVATADKFTDAATWLKGFLTAIDGIPILISEFMRDDLNASGIYDGSTTTYTAILLAHFASYMIGERRTLTVKSKEDIETDQQILVTTQRLDFEKMFATTEPCGAYGYKITA